MAKFRAPSTSVASIASVSTFNTHEKIIPGSTKLKKKHAGPRRVRTKNLDKAKAAVKDAAKRNHKTMQVLDPSTVFVGNLSPEVDESALIAHFRDCGNILSAQIHCCGGVALTTTPPPNGYHKNQRVRQYGIMTFATKSGRHKAIKLGCSQLGGRQITVSLSICDLPEVKEKILKRVQGYCDKFDSPDVRRAKKSALKPLKLEPTVLLDTSSAGEEQVGPKLFGVSLRMGIM
ncbi:hypothetical protein BU15DRAFT_58108 [Melanogaster broomeanus]|nr:hypothetical protein BU15DRAFT_58108 [Melanogaster broomeanus]